MVKMKKILVVDDSRLARMVVFKHLASCYDVDTAASAEAALDLLAQSAYDVIISDINMPGQSGLELLQICVDRSDCCEIILMTAEPNVADAVKAMRIGAYDYLEKKLRSQQTAEYC